MSDDNEQPDSDGLDALASGLQANESEDADEELDLASLAAVVGTRTSSVAGEDSPVAGAAEKLVLKAPVGASVAPAAAPPAAPAPAPSAEPKRGWLVPTLIAFAVGVGVMGYVLGRSSRSEDGTATEQRVEAPAPAATPTVAIAAPPAPPSPVTAPSAPQPAPASESPSISAGPAHAAAPRLTARPNDPTPKPSTGAAIAPAGEATPSATPAEPAQAAKPSEPAALAKTEPASSRSVDQLLDEALASPAERRAAAVVAASTGLPEAPTREEVTQAMAVLLPAIRGCAMGQSGLATAGIVVRGDGRVASVELTGAPFEGTASGRCMEGVLRRARFSRFKQPTFRVRFPFSIQ